MKNTNNNTDEIQIGDFVKHSEKYWKGLLPIKDRLCFRRMIVLDIKYDEGKKYVRVYNVRSDHSFGADKTYEWTIEQLEKIC